MQTTHIATISLGRPITAPVLVPVEHKSTPICINDPFMVDGECYGVTAMSLGSPHGAVFVDSVDDIDVPVLGAKLGNHVLFPEGANIVFIQMRDKESLKIRIWQRDKGETGFTPEAVGVAGIAAIMLQKVLGYTVDILSDGNTFQVKWNRGNGEVSLSGPAELCTVNTAH